MVKKLSYKKFYQWLDTCPVSWNETNHPTSGMTSVTFDLEKVLTKEKPKVKKIVLTTTKLFFFSISFSRDVPEM